MIRRSPEENHEFDNIYSVFYEKIHRYLTRLIGENEAEDVVQEVFLKIHDSLGTFRGESSLSTWIYRIATNTATDYLRRCRANQSTYIEDEHSDGDTLLSANDTAVDRTIIRKEMNDCIRGLADNLPENYRTVLILSDFEELTNNQIAEVLGVSIETVKIRLHRARARLKKELEHHCSFYRDERNELACDRKTLPLQFLSK